MTITAKIHPHNDLLNLAHYHHSVINEKNGTPGAEAIALDCMSCLIALAFSVEALINFVGAKCIDQWAERQPFHKKLSALEATIGLAYDKAREPYSTIEKLKTLRDQMAHGKPIEVNTVAPSKEDLKRAMRSPWDEFLLPAFVNHAYDQVCIFENNLLALGKIPLVETLTSGFRSWKET
jgi:hypothetical protein